jgi:hypothetical protein
MEDQADKIHDAGLALFVESRGGDTLRFIIQREIYSHLQRSNGPLRGCSQRIDGLVIDHA